MFFCLPVHSVIYIRSFLSFKERKKKKMSHTKSSRTATKLLLVKHRSVSLQRKFTKVFIKFQELPETVEELSYNIHHIYSNFIEKKT